MKTSLITQRIALALAVAALSTLSLTTTSFAQEQMMKDGDKMMKHDAMESDAMKMKSGDKMMKHDEMAKHDTVSYTHLTLPTILLV